MIGRTLSHYRIVEKIGSGGMGEVYRARDDRLARDVAIKVLPHHAFADASARSRFRNEAVALSRLNHPGIATIHDFDHDSGVDFLVMEYVDGQTLQATLREQPGALSEPEAVGLALQMAEALEEAHARGLVHRDLKPGNVAVTSRGRVKLLDFGLATAVTAQDDLVTVSQHLGPVGTLPYMAPESLMGAPPDARTDVYAFGVVLYEMVTARRPFEASPATAMVDEILHGQPASPRTIRPGVSSRLESLILKCLEKAPADRFQSASELLVGLRQLADGVPSNEPRPGRRRALGWRSRVAALAAAGALASGAYLLIGGSRPGTAPLQGRVMLAVLPFDNLSPDPDREYFSDGLTEELISQLGRLHPDRLGVIARTSVMTYKNRARTIDQIGRELDVDYVLEGSVRTEAGRARITTQLVQVVDQTPVWTESYERPLSDIFGLQRDVARRVARSLAGELLPAAEATLARGAAGSVDAYEAYLRGRYFWNQRTGEGFQKARQEFERAIALDPDYALAYSGLADTYMLLSSYGQLTADEARVQARSLAARALALDETLAEAHTSFASVLSEFDNDMDGAEQAFLRALALNPSYALAHQWYATVLAQTGRVEAAIEHMEQARALDPLNPRINVDLGRAYYYARQYDRAIGHCLNALELEPEFAGAHSMLGLAYLEVGRFDESIAAIRRGAGAEAPSLWLGHVFARAGRTSEARQMLDRWRESWDAKGRPEANTPLADRAPRAIAMIHAGLGEPDLAFEWLGRARDVDTGLLQDLQSAPYWDGLRSDPRFEALVTSTPR